MNKTLLKGLASILAVLAFACQAGCEATPQQPSGSNQSVRLILKYMTKDYSSQLMAGAQTAANEYGIDLDIQSLSINDDPARQAEMLENAYKLGESAVILMAERSDALEAVLNNGRRPNVPVVFVDTEWLTDNSFCSIKTDGEQLKNDIMAQLQIVSGSEGSVYILNSICPAGETNDKEILLTSALKSVKGCRVEVIYYDTEFQEEVKNIIKSNINDTGKNKTIIALDGLSSAAAAAAVKESNQNINLIAFGSSLDLVSEMENGRVNAMVVENAFTKGYMAVQSAMEAVKKGTKPQDILLKAKIVTLQNLYLPENQKLIFPLT